MGSYGYNNSKYYNRDVIRNISELSGQAGYKIIFIKTNRISQYNYPRFRLRFCYFSFLKHDLQQKYLLK